MTVNGAKRSTFLRATCGRRCPKAVARVRAAFLGSRLERGPGRLPGFCHAGSEQSPLSPACAPSRSAPSQLRAIHEGNGTMQVIIATIGAFRPIRAQRAHSISPAIISATKALSIRLGSALASPAGRNAH